MLTRRTGEVGGEAGVDAVSFSLILPSPFPLLAALCSGSLEEMAKGASISPLSRSRALLINLFPLTLGLIIRKGGSKINKHFFHHIPHLPAQEFVPLHQSEYIYQPQQARIQDPATGGGARPNFR